MIGSDPGSLDDFRRRMEDYRASREVDKDSHAAVPDTIAWYRRLPPAEMRLADEVVGEWVLSDNETDRYDARVMAVELGIRGAVPALESLRSRLRTADGPSARFELAAVERALTALESWPSEDFARLDVVLRPWAETQGLHVQTRHRDDDVRSISIVDARGGESQLWIEPRHGRFIVHVSRNAPKQERRSWAADPVDIDDVHAALGRALSVTRSWEAHS